MLQRLSHFLSRRTSIATSPYLTLSEKASILFSRHALAEDVLQKKVQKREKDFLLEIGQFNVSIPIVSDEVQANKDRQFLAQVARETFLEPVIFDEKVKVKRGDIVLDLGGNIGTTALYFSSLVGDEGKVFAFEPGVEDILQNNVTINNAKNVEVVAKAVGKELAELELFMGDNFLDSSMVNKLSTHVNTKKVDVVTLDSFVEEKGLKKLDFIKVDIEGAEEDAIRGSIETIKKFKPKWSISSYHTDFEGDPQHPKLLKLLKELGYETKEIPGFHIYAW